MAWRLHSISAADFDPHYPNTHLEAEIIRLSSYVHWQKHIKSITAPHKHLRDDRTLSGMDTMR